MTENYFNLKRKLEELGYNYNLPLEAVPLVECVLADLLQTTRSLQHYMDLSKEAITQRDKLVLEVEPYKCDNTKLIQENNRLHKELMIAKEQIEKQCKDNKRQIKSLSDELKKKDMTISKLQHDLRDLGLRGLCAGTVSSRIKSLKKESSSKPHTCTCRDNKIINVENDLLELKKQIQSLEDQNHAYGDEIKLLKNQVDNRDNEITRLNIMLEGGRPLQGLKTELNSNDIEKVQELLQKINKLESVNEAMKKELKAGLEKQHEAMLRAVNLADDNKYLKEELNKIDGLALKVEEECNSKLASMKTELNVLQIKNEQLTLRNLQLERLLSNKHHGEVLSAHNLQESLNTARSEKDSLQKEIRELRELNKNLQEKVKKNEFVENTSPAILDELKYATKDDLQNLLEKERKTYEQHMTNLQDRLTDTINHFEKHLSWCRSKGDSPSVSQVFVNDLHNKVCESEQKILMLKKENEELQRKMFQEQDNSKQNYKDIVNQLNIENSELIKENLSMSRQLSQYRNLASHKSSDDGILHRNLNKLESDLDQLKQENRLLSKDKQEYKVRYKECMDQIENLKRDLIMKQKQVEQLEEENCSYKMTSRTGKASTEHLKDECNFLREQIKRMQTDVIKEKTLSSQIKNIQIETERSSYELQNELLNTQKQLTLTNNDVESLQKKCKDLQDEVMTLKADKSNLISNIKKVDQERDQLVLELDKKTETLSALEHKIMAQNFEIEKYEKQLTDLKQKLNINKVAEHKLEDSDAQIRFLNGEIARLNRQFENAVLENKQLQNSLADVNGNLKITRIEYEKSRKEVEGLKQQLQHYVAEIRRIEELLSQKEAERSDMLEHFASLSVEANILENNNHSLESESASKSVQLQSYVSKISELESKILDRDNEIENQAARISTMACKITALESEVKLITEEKEISEKNVSCLKKLCSNLQSEKSHISKGMDNTDSELKLYETKIRTLSNTRVELESEKTQLKETLQSTEKLLSNARKEVIELKLALQDATSETKILQDRLARLQNRDAEFTEAQSRDELELPLMLEETIHEVSHEEDEESSRFHEVRKRLSKYTHSGTI